MTSLSQIKNLVARTPNTCCPTGADLRLQGSRKSLPKKTRLVKPCLVKSTSRKIYVSSSSSNSSSSTNSSSSSSSNSSPSSSSSSSSSSKSNQKLGQIQEFAGATQPFLKSCVGGAYSKRPAKNQRKNCVISRSSQVPLSPS